MIKMQSCTWITSFQNINYFRLDLNKDATWQTKKVEGEKLRDDD
jgi:hypothetical protein